MKKKNNALVALTALCLLCLSCEELLEPSLDKQTVIILVPVNNLVSADSLQTFYWQIIKGATAYQLQIVSPRFDSIIRLVTDTTILNNQFNFGLLKGSFQWRVRALNNSTNSLYSENRKLTIQ